MKTFLCAMCILLLLVALMIANTYYIATLTERMLEETAALPRAEEADCAAAAAALEARWQRMRLTVSLSVNSRTVEQIDRLVVSLRVTAESGAAIDFELNRALLSAALRELMALTVCDVWGVV